MADWTTISSLATAAGTLVLAGATFASVRSANRSAQATERALLAGIRPLLVPSRPEDPPEKVGFRDDVWVRVEGGRAAVLHTDDGIYMAIALKNAGTGLAVLDRWDFQPQRMMGDSIYRNVDDFRRLTRDLYIPGGDRGFWQGAFRRGEPEFDGVVEAVEARSPMTIDLLYGDHEGGQHTISRFTLLPIGDDGGWLAIVVRHWNLDRDDPR